MCSIYFTFILCLTISAPVPSSTSPPLATGSWLSWWCSVTISKFCWLQIVTFDLSPTLLAPNDGVINYMFLYGFEQPPAFSTWAAFLPLVFLVYKLVRPVPYMRTVTDRTRTHLHVGGARAVVWQFWAWSTVLKLYNIDFIWDLIQISITGLIEL